jgi:hypothetical protein
MLRVLIEQPEQLDAWLAQYPARLKCNGMQA